jgi:hypothetical protein
LGAGAAPLALSLAALGAEIAARGQALMTWFDLDAYYHAGLLAAITRALEARWKPRPTQSTPDRRAARATIARPGAR